MPGPQELQQAQRTYWALACRLACQPIGALATLGPAFDAAVFQMGDPVSSVPAALFSQRDRRRRRSRPPRRCPRPPRPPCPRRRRHRRRHASTSPPPACSLCLLASSHRLPPPAAETKNRDAAPVQAVPLASAAPPCKVHLGVHSAAATVGHPKTQPTAGVTCAAAEAAPKLAPPWLAVQILESVRFEHCEHPPRPLYQPAAHTSGRVGHVHKVA